MCRYLCPSIVVTFLSSLLLQAGETGSTPSFQRGHAIETIDKERIRRGRQLAGIFCSSCHLNPPPELLPRHTWDFVLTWMGNFLGYEHRQPPFANLVRPEQVARRPMLSRQDFDAIRAYYRHAAPERPLPQLAKPEPRSATSLFRVAQTAFRVMEPPLVTLLAVDEVRGRVAVGDGLAKELLIFTPSGTLRERHRLSSQPIAIRFDPQGFVLTLIGDLDRDRRRGQILRYRRTRDGYDIHPILTGHHRISHTLFQDLDGDGLEDIVVSAFGDYDRGRFSWLENLGHGRYREHVLIDRSGAVNAVVHDFTGDGLPELLVLLAQGRNELVLFTNRGRGRFEQRQILEQPPGFGYHALVAADLDGDALLDLVTVNGNNMEIRDAPLRRYHGIRIYRNEGRLNFRERYFYPMYGAIQAAVADFDRNGLSDLAVVSYFPDWSLDRPESFLILDNQGNFRFTPYAVPGMSSGRWMRVEAADLNADGKPDILLGNALNESGVPQDLLKRYRQHVADSPAVLVLLNDAPVPTRAVP